MSTKSQALLAWPITGDDTRLSAAVSRLAEADGPADLAGTWPEELWKTLIEARATLWALPRHAGGDECDRVELLERYARVAEGSMTAAFILSQHDAGVRRLLAANNCAEADRWIGAIARGEAFTTVGISQLTTSRRHGSQAMRAAMVEGGGFRLDGTMPWVTAAERADVLIAGAVLDDGRQILVALPARRAGLTVRPPFDLAALEASRTTEVACTAVAVSENEVLAGPSADVMAHPGAAGTGGLETSALALGQSRAALAALIHERAKREDLTEPLDALASEWNDLWSALMATARGEPDALPPAQVRVQANGLVVRSTQAYLTARKGTGFLRSEPAQRWARQALFFLVWSCPSPVASAAIRDLAGLCPA